MHICFSWFHYGFPKSTEEKPCPIGRSPKWTATNSAELGDWLTVPSWHIQTSSCMKSFGCAHFWQHEWLMNNVKQAPLGKIHWSWQRTMCWHGLKWPLWVKPSGGLLGGLRQLLWLVRANCSRPSGFQEMLLSSTPWLGQKEYFPPLCNFWNFDVFLHYSTCLDGVFLNGCRKVDASYSPGNYHDK